MSDCLQNCCTSDNIYPVFEKLFNHKCMREFTSLIHGCNVLNTLDTSCDMKKVTCKGEINFIQYFIQRRSIPADMGCCYRYEFRILIEYILEDTCKNQRKLQRFFDILNCLMEDEPMKSNWDSSVTHTLPNREYPSIVQGQPINEGQPIYIGQTSYYAILNKQC